MIKKIKQTVNLSLNMGLRYILFRFFYLIKTKLGWHKIVFPVKFKTKNFTTLNNWKNNLPPFFFYGKEIQKLPKEEKEILVETFQEIQKGTYTFFNKSKIDLGSDYDWVTNPLTNYKYDVNKHWSEIQDLSKEAGDIKYVWEKARFSFLYDIIRYDYHFNDDQSKLVFKEIEDFINKNPINQGPNYKCSQEISLRILNWTFALYYYKDSKNLNENLFQIIINNIYWQIHHVYNNINFSRISVRNNHAITETLLLFLSQKLFPFFPNVKKWSKKGKRWFEQEITYQIYPDGTFLQFSMNYHRTVVQLLTWSIQLAKLNNDEFISDVYDRAKKSLSFLDSCMDPKSGELPNYGSNDGALFFKLTDNDYRNYQSQLDDLRAVLFGFVKKNSESQQWYGLKSREKNAFLLFHSERTFVQARCDRKYLSFVTHQRLAQDLAAKDVLRIRLALNPGQVFPQIAAGVGEAVREVDAVVVCGEGVFEAESVEGSAVSILAEVIRYVLYVLADAVPAHSLTLLRLCAER